MKQDPHITPTGWLYEIGPWFTDEESQKKRSIWMNEGIILRDILKSCHVEIYNSKCIFTLKVGQI